jgi:membrane protein
VIGLMVFAYFVSRFLLILTAWAAVAPAKVPENHQRLPHEVPPPPPPPPAEIPPDVVVGLRPDVQR